MNTIWANRLIAEDKSWSDVPVNRKNAVKEILIQRVADGIISNETYESIIGEKIAEE